MLLYNKDEFAPAPPPKKKKNYDFMCNCPCYVRKELW